MDEIPIPKYIDLDLITPDNARFFVKLTFFTATLDLTDTPLWHICLPELSNVTGHLAFCGLRSHAKVQTQNRQRLYDLMHKDRGELCSGCGDEFVIAQPVLQARGYLSGEII